MSELVEFLKARLDEAEKLAVLAKDEWCMVDFNGQDNGEFGFSVAPTRILADVAAKWAIIDICATGFGDYYFDGISWEIIRHLASAYSDHPDFQDAWRPR